MRVIIVRTMQEFSMDVYANGIISGLKTVRPDWEIVDLAPCNYDRTSSSLLLRVIKYYERFWRFPRLVRQQSADVFHIIEPAEAHIVYWLQKTAKTVVVTCHDLINFYYSGNLQGSVQLPFVSKNVWLFAVKGMKYANHIFSVSCVTAKDTTKLLNIEPAKITVTPNAVEPIYRQLSLSEIESFYQNHNCNAQTTYLLNVGANHPRKNIFTILESLNILKQKEISFKFWKVGADFTDEQKQYIQEHQLENYITYFGKPDKKTLVEIYNAADMLIAPSLHEGFGITILEAMACGTPVITSNTSAMPEVAGDAAILVNPQEPQAISQAVVRLHNDAIYYQELVDKGLSRAKLFTWEKTAEKLADVYEKLLANKN